MSAPSGPLVRFGAFELDPRSGELRKAGVQDQPPRSAVSRAQDAARPAWRARDSRGAAATAVVGRDIRGFRARPECRGSPAARGAGGLGRDAEVRRDAAAPRLSIHRSCHWAFRKRTMRAPVLMASPPAMRIRRPVLTVAIILAAVLVLGASGYSLWRPESSRLPADTFDAGCAPLREPDWRSRSGVHQ